MGNKEKTKIILTSTALAILVSVDWYLDMEVIAIFLISLYIFISGSILMNLTK